MCLPRIDVIFDIIFIGGKLTHPNPAMSMMRMNSCECTGRF
jgi:hypothetical protein